MNNLAVSAPQPRAKWMEETLTRQLSAERDFVPSGPVTFQYAILCGHRMGSNLLTETLYETGVLRFLQKYLEERGMKALSFADYMAEMKRRRTSPNGVFGFNIKVDQFMNCFKENQAEGISFIKNCNYVLFLYRKDKIRQAVSQYIGQQRDTFRIPAGADYSEVEALVSSVPFNPAAIAGLLHQCILQEQMWIDFMKTHNIAHDVLAYEDLVDDYEGTINEVLDALKIPESDRTLPDIPTMKVSTTKNEEFAERFADLLTGEKNMPEALGMGAA